jgi:hypothetical protein
MELGKSKWSDTFRVRMDNQTVYTLNNLFASFLPRKKKKKYKRLIERIHGQRLHALGR